MMQDFLVSDLMVDLDTVRHYVLNLHWGDALHMLEQCISIYSSSPAPDTDALKLMENTMALIKRAFDDTQMDRRNGHIDDIQLQVSAVHNLDSLLRHLDRFADYPLFNKSVNSSEGVSMSLLRRFDDEILRLDNLVAAEAWDEFYYRLSGGEGIHYLCEAMVAQGVVQESFEDVCFDILDQIESYVDDIRDADEDERANVAAVKGSEISGLLSQLQGLAYDYQVYSSRRNKSVNSSEGVSMSQFYSRAGRPAHRLQSAWIQDHLDELGHEFVVAVEVLRDHVIAGRWSSVWNDCDTLYSIAKEVEGVLAGANQRAMDNVFAHLVKVNEVVYECSTVDSEIYRSDCIDRLDDYLNRVLGAMDFVVRHS